MKIEDIEDKKNWEDFVRGFTPNNFLASWEWGDFNETLGEKVFRLALFKGKDIEGVCMAIKVQARRGSFLLCPASPLFKGDDIENWRLVVNRLKEIAVEEEVNFIRIRPLYEKGRVDQYLDKLAPKKSPTHVHAQVSWILALDKAEDKLLLDMRKTTRYLIRQAEKIGVQVEIQDDKKGVETLEKLQEQTVKRHNFTPFSNKYLEKEFEVFGETAKILVAKKGKTTLASAMIIFYGDSAFYHHGASVETKIPATYLLQWEAIKLAKSDGKKYYNFWGIAPTESKGHPWAGLTLFKKGFGGFQTEYTLPRDIPMKASYPVIYWFEKLRAYKRGLS